MTRHLDGLEEAGLVERRRDPVDRRAVQVQLTRAGHALRGRLLKAVIAFNQQLRTGLSSDEIEALRRVLTQLRENVA
jgi:MarR family transcriptional regulator for hemolysin